MSQSGKLLQVEAAVKARDTLQMVTAHQIQRRILEIIEMLVILEARADKAMVHVVTVVIVADILHHVRLQQNNQTRLLLRLKSKPH